MVLLCRVNIDIILTSCCKCNSDKLRYSGLGLSLMVNRLPFYFFITLFRLSDNVFNEYLLWFCHRYLGFCWDYRVSSRFSWITHRIVNLVIVHIAGCSCQSIYAMYCISLYFTFLYCVKFSFFLLSQWSDIMPQCMIHGARTLWEDQAANFFFHIDILNFSSVPSPSGVVNLYILLVAVCNNLKYRFDRKIKKNIAFQFRKTPKYFILQISFDIPYNCHKSFIFISLLVWSRDPKMSHYFCS